MALIALKISFELNRFADFFIPTFEALPTKSTIPI